MIILVVMIMLPVLYGYGHPHNQFMYIVLVNTSCRRDNRSDKYTKLVAMSVYQYWRSKGYNADLLELRRQQTRYHLILSSAKPRSHHEDMVSHDVYFIGLV